MLTYTKQFWIDAFERVLSTMAQALLAIIGMDSFTPATVNWQQTLVGVGLAGLAALLKAIVAGQVGSPRTAALLPVSADTERGQANTNFIIGVLLVVLLVVVILKIVGAW